MDAVTAVSREEAAARLDDAWEELGPVDHPYATVYRNAADDIVKRAVGRRAGGAEILDVEWLIERPGAQIGLRPDHVERGVDGPIVRRLRTGRPPRKLTDDIYALYLCAAKQELPGAKVEALFLTTDEAVPVAMTDKTIARRLGNYDAAIDGLRKGLFPARPGDRKCPRCPQYFICPVVPPSAPGD